MKLDRKNIFFIFLVIIFLLFAIKEKALGEAILIMIIIFTIAYYYVHKSM